MVNINNLYNRYYGGNYSHNVHLPTIGSDLLTVSNTASPVARAGVVVVQLSLKNYGAIKHICIIQDYIQQYSLKI